MTTENVTFSHTFTHARTRIQLAVRKSGETAKRSGGNDESASINTHTDTHPFCIQRRAWRRFVREQKPAPDVHYQQAQFTHTHTHTKPHISDCITQTHRVHRHSHTHRHIRIILMCSGEMRCRENPMRATQ